jgi:hypothetical protein
MKDFARPGRSELIFFDPGDKVRWRNDASAEGPYETTTVVRTARTRVLIKRGKREEWVPNLHLSHDPDFHRDCREW